LSRLALCSALALATPGVCAPLHPLSTGDLARVVAFGQVLLDERDIRIVTVPRTIGECWGTVKSCPDIDLYISYYSGDLYAEPQVYRLGAAKGWEFAGWESDGTFMLKTTLNLPNIDSAERAAWRQITYRVTVSDGKAVVDEART